MASSVSTGADTAISGPGTQKPTFQQRITDFLEFLYNGENGEVMGRSARRWGEIGIFYIVYYACLAGFWAALMAIFYQTIDWNYPKLSGADSLLKQNPGLGFRPMPDVATTLIRFVKGDASTFTTFTDGIESYLQYYENEMQETETGEMIDCGTYSSRRPNSEWDKACRFDISAHLGADCVKQQAFGFEDGQPCILLKLNRLYDWLPEEYTNETVPAEIAAHWDQWHITVTCKGESAADEDNMGMLTYYPRNGFHFKYFPFKNQQGYRSPVMFVRFEQPNPGVLLMVECKAWAKNIRHERMTRAGSVHFELLVD